MNRFIACVCKATMVLIIAASSISCASHSSVAKNVDLVGLWRCSTNSEFEICFTPKGHVLINHWYYKFYKIEGETLFYKESDTEDKWKSSPFEMVTEDVFIIENYHVFTRKK